MFAEIKPIKKVNPRYRAYGRARIDTAQRAQSQSDWQKMWKPSPNPFPFVWGRHWKNCLEYQVDDFAAEIGFFIDVLGLPVNAFNPEMAMFTSPDYDFYFSVVPTPPGSSPTPPGTLRIQFMVDDLFEVTKEFVRRGIVFEQEPLPVSEGSSQWLSSFLTPNGISIELWGQVEAVQHQMELNDQRPEEMQVEDENLLENHLVREEIPAYAVLEQSSNPPASKLGEVVEKQSALQRRAPDSAPAKPQSVRSAPAVENPPRSQDNFSVLLPAEDLDDELPVLSSTQSVKNARIQTSLSPASTSQAKPVTLTRPNIQEKPARVFKSGTEILDHLRNQPASTQPNAFRPAPKPVPASAQTQSEGGDSLDNFQAKKNHYPLISLDNPDEEQDF